MKSMVNDFKPSTHEVSDSMEPTKPFVQKGQLHCAEEIFSHPPKGGQSTHMRLNYKEPSLLAKRFLIRFPSHFGQTNVRYVGPLSKEIFGHICQNPSVSMSKRLHVVIFQFSFINLEYIP